MGFLNSFGKRMIKISSIYMLPKGRKATNALIKTFLGRKYYFCGLENVRT